VDVMVGQFDAALAPAALALARDLRAAGLRVDLHCDATKIGKQFQDADTHGVPCVALVGPDEVTNGTVSVKHLKTGEKVVLLPLRGGGVDPRAGSVRAVEPLRLDPVRDGVGDPASDRDPRGEAASHLGR